VRGDWEHEIRELTARPVLALIGIATLPLLLAGGFIRLHVVILKDAKTKKIHEASAHLAAEATGAVKTVAALTREADVAQIYRERLEDCKRLSM
jgi:ATP-binding cassette subfamily B (MDR/TAP) protein 1